MTTRFAVFCALALHVVAAHAQVPTTEYAVVFDGAVAMEKLPKEGAGLRLQAADGSEIYIHSCGYAKITYRLLPLSIYVEDSDAKPQERDLLYMMGEWCQSSFALFETNRRVEHLISFFERGGTEYLDSFARVYLDANGDAYVEDPAFIEFNDLQAQTREVVHGPDDTGCIYLAETDDAGAGRILVGDMYCFERGVYLTDILKAAAP